MAKNEITVKSNGLRNELKEIRKSIDKLTAVMVDIVDAIDVATAQTNKRYENNTNTACCNDSKLCKCKKTKDS